MSIFGSLTLAGYAVETKISRAGTEPDIRVLTNDTSKVVTLPLEEYLRGVVPSEIGTGAPEQAKCAQAVAARSFAAVALNSSKHKADGADVCSTVHCQVYSGLSKATASTDAAVSETRGLVLTYKGKPIPAYYAAHCGGHTEDIRNSWPERSSEKAYHGTARFDGTAEPELDLAREKDFLKWLAGSPASYCNPAKSQVLEWAGRNFRWMRQLTAEEVTSCVAKQKGIGRVLKIRTGERGASGRLKQVVFVGENGELRVGPQIEIRQLFHPMLKSSAFAVETSGPVSRPTHFVLRGAGSGHAVGMCQTGSMGMANAGKSFREILKHYYPTARVAKQY
ncbi:MAG: SpoIID/LytB domain-containing protein [Candidatus Sumerlaeaceae bacterium]